MRTADAAGVAAVGVAALVERAGYAIAREAQRLLGRSYGRRVTVICGPGLNGADGRIAARVLRSRGCHVEILDATSTREIPTTTELVIDAAYGLGCSRPYHPPRVPTSTLVLAVDLPSGVDPDTGSLMGEPLPATTTLALGALKFAHVLEPAASRCGNIRTAQLGLDTTSSAQLMEDGDLLGFHRETANDHKWKHAVAVVAGSPLMPGAADLVCQGALSAGASMVRCTSRSELSTLRVPVEVVRAEAPLDSRVRAVVVGPGLGPDTQNWTVELVREVTVPIVLDADALQLDVVQSLRGHDLVLTPHEGEFQRLSGQPLRANRVVDVLTLARELQATILLKGPTTIVASPQGEIRIVRAGTSALATAGSGDVLAGMIGGALARGHGPLDAASLSAQLHGLAGQRLRPYETASALGLLVTTALDALRH